MSISLAKDNESLRDEIAIAAMRKLIKYKYIVGGFSVDANIKEVAEASYAMADAMLEARKR